MTFHFSGILNALMQQQLINFYKNCVINLNTGVYLKN
jgi:hypothetical protein